MLGIPIPAKYKNLFSQTSRAALAQYLRKAVEPNEAELEKALALIEIMRTMPQRMRPALKQVTKELPRARSGPKKILSVDQEIAACARIDLLRTEYSDREAVQQVARKYKVSERTMYRIWSTHRKRTKKSSVKYV